MTRIWISGTLEAHHLEISDGLADKLFLELMADPRYEHSVMRTMDTFKPMANIFTRDENGNHTEILIPFKHSK